MHFLLSDLGWLDEKVDLSILDNPNGLLDHPNETETSMEDDTAILLGFLDGGFNPSYLPSDSFKNVENELFNCLDISNYSNEIASSEILNTHLASPQCSNLQVDSNAFFPIHSPASPYSEISEAPEETSSNYILQSPEAPSVTSDLTSNSIDSSQIQVTVCNDIPSSSDFVQQALNIEEVSTSVRKRKYESEDEESPKIKVILKSSQSPAQSSSKPRDRRERKKIQNKEAAARYRIKKRMEEKVLSDEVENLESHQKKLKEKHDELQMEIKYLKNLMCEILQKKGILK